MLKKVAGAAQDRLKQRLHQHGHHGPPSSAGRPGPRQTRSKGQQAAVTFSAVDNAAFEQILNDDTDFTTELETPPPPPPPHSHSHSSPARTDPAREDTDLFDDSMFDNYQGPEALGGNSAPSTATEDPLFVSYDPLSGQIIPQSVPSDDSNGTKIGNEEMEFVAPVNGTSDRNADCAIAGYPMDDPPTLSLSDPEVLMTDELFFADSAKIAAEDDAHFQPAVNSAAENQSLHSAEDSDQEFSSANGLDIVHADVSKSPASSLPSSVESDAWNMKGHGQNSDSPLVGSNAQDAVDKRRGEETHSHAESSASDLESELEQLLAPRYDHTSHVVGVAGVSGNVQRRLFPDVEVGGSGHLDSGVFEHDGGNNTPEREGAITATNKDTDSLPIHDDHFVSNMPTAKSSSSSSLVPPQAPPPLSGSPNQNRRGSSGKVPPTRPPMSPQVQKRMKAIQKPVSPAGTHPSGHVTTNHDGGEGVAVQQVRPLGRARPSPPPPAKAPATTAMGKGEELLSSDDDELFPDDLKKLRDMDNDRLTRQHTSEVDTASERPIQTKPSSSSSTRTQEREHKSEFILPFPYHMFLSLLLYLYYSLNVFPYLSGLFAGFLMLYVVLGSVFIYYVQATEKEREERRQGRKEAVLVSEDFVRTMKVDFSKLKEYQSNKFTATLNYDLSSHHPSQRMPAELSLRKDFLFAVSVCTTDNFILLTKNVDIRRCKVGIEPAEVARNRKRRWSKKFPIVISCSDPRQQRFTVYLFSPTARDKEDWFRRLKSAASGLTAVQLIRKQQEFFGYMEKYFPPELLESLSLQPKVKPHPIPPPQQHGSRSAGSQRLASTLVQFSKAADDGKEASVEDNAERGGVNITQKQKVNSHSQHATTSSASGASSSQGASSGRPVKGQDHDSARLSSSLDENGIRHVHTPPSSSAAMGHVHMSNQWLNSLAARLCWDIWHEKRWKDWVMTRIQKKLIRIKTPSFMEQLRLTNIDVGNDMPMINQLIGGPRMDLRGLWVYLDVTYQGKFVMTIETKMKLGGGSTSQEEAGQQMTSLNRSNSSPPLSRRAKSPRPLNHVVSAQMLGSSVDPEDEIDSGSDEEEGSGHHHHPLLAEDLANTQELLHQGHTPSTVPTDHAPPAPSSANKGRIASMVTMVAKKVVNTKLVRRAAEKVSNYSLVLTVEVNRLDGVLAVNIPPPPSDAIWWGFHGSPKLELVAKPKVGQREVKLTRVTHWIEKKLCEIVDKKVVLPEMEDLIVPILNSGMAEDKLKPISTDSEPATPTT